MDRGEIYTDRLLTGYPGAHEYEVTYYGRIFCVVVTSQESVVRRWVSRLISPDIPLTRRVMAIIILKLPDDSLLDEDPRRQPPLATIQLCINGHCLIFQIARARHFPSAIREFLQDGRFMFFAWMNDHRILRQHYGVILANMGWLYRLGYTDRRYMIEQAVLCQLRRRVSFPVDVFLSRWDAHELSIDQVQYAAIEACLAVQIVMTRIVFY